MQKMPRELFFVAPMECKHVKALPTGDAWQYEIKFDGYRAIALKQRGEVQLFSRRGNSFTSKYPEIADALNHLRAKSFILDGEIVALDEQGRHSFSLLQKRTSKKPLVRFYRLLLRWRRSNCRRAIPFVGNWFVAAPLSFSSLLLARLALLFFHLTLFSSRDVRRRS
jgi:hypothetical protein